MNCPFCNTQEIPDEFPSASQRFSTFKFTCGTELVFCGDAGIVEKQCEPYFEEGLEVVVARLMDSDETLEVSIGLPELTPDGDIVYSTDYQPTSVNHRFIKEILNLPLTKK